MNSAIAPGKRSNYPFSVALILLVHLALGYLIYQKVAQPNQTNNTELKAISTQTEEPALP